MKKRKWFWITAVALTALNAKGIAVGSHIARCGGVADRAFSENLTDELAALNEKVFAVLDKAAGERMK